MAQIGDAKGEYRGLAYRGDADLKAWLAKRPSEAALSSKREFPLRLESVIQTQSRVMPRRGEEMSEAQRRVVEHLYRASVNEPRVG